MEVFNKYVWCCNDCNIDKLYEESTVETLSSIVKQNYITMIEFIKECFNCILCFSRYDCSSIYSRELQIKRSGINVTRYFVINKLFETTNQVYGIVRHPATEGILFIKHTWYDVPTTIILNPDIILGAIFFGYIDSTSYDFVSGMISHDHHLEFICNIQGLTYYRVKQKIITKPAIKRNQSP